MTVVESSQSLNKLLDQLEDDGKIGDPLEVLSSFETWAERSGRPLYPHQVEAAEQIILADRHLIAPTPTGSGKSLIGVAGILWALARGGVAYYTAPLKALVAEKFFDLVDLFGAANVGMVTGDGSVNADAPIICATAEILANQALRWGETLDVDTIVMDEFHYYGETDRGWAWQAPLLLLTQARFVLMSATLGDTSFFVSDLQQRTGREVAVLDCAKRPVPLTMAYRVEPVEKLLVELARADKLPAYLVHSSQRRAVEEAERIAGLNLDLGVDAQHLAQLKSELKTAGFNSAFGKTLKPLLLQGIGIHHAGMLPRYRRLVERLAGMGLLKLISGTDTLGVGINVPIRTVVMTSLVKFDGSKERHLNAREFHQVAGRAGRAGFDTEGYVYALAPEWEVENAAALAKAGDDPKRRAKVKKKKAPEGRTTWSEGTFKRLVDSQPGALSPHWQITHAMVLNTLQRPGNQRKNLLDLAVDNHNVRRFGKEAQTRYEQSLQEILDSLLTSGIINGNPESGYKLVGNLPDTFALNQSLAPFALDYLQTFNQPTRSNQEKLNHENPTRITGNPTPDSLTTPSPTAPSLTAPGGGGAGNHSALHEVMDIISVVESVLEDPGALLISQEKSEKNRVFAQLKAAGASYEQRQAILEKITYPRPLETELNAAFHIYSEANPWAKVFRIKPKSVLREMIENGETFSSYVSRLNSAFAEGQLLRYLSDAWRALNQIVPAHLRTQCFEEVLDWLQNLIKRVDSSLLDEWQYLENPQLRAQSASGHEENSAEETQRAFGQRQDGSFDWNANPHVATGRLLRDLADWLDALAGDEFELLAKMEATKRENYLAASETSQPAVSTVLDRLPKIGVGGWDQMLGGYWDAHDFIDAGMEGRNKRNFRFWTSPKEYPRLHPDLEKILPALAASPHPDRETQGNETSPSPHPDTDLWLGELTLVDGEHDLDFGFYLAINPNLTLNADTDHSFPAWIPLGIFERL